MFKFRLPRADFFRKLRATGGKATSLVADLLHRHHCWRGGHGTQALGLQTLGSKRACRCRGTRLLSTQPRILREGSRDHAILLEVAEILRPQRALCQLL